MPVPEISADSPGDCVTVGTGVAVRAGKLQGVVLPTGVAPDVLLLLLLLSPAAENDQFTTWCWHRIRGCIQKY